MKGALLKEFYIWKNTGLIYLLLVLISIVAWSEIGSVFITVLLGLIAGVTVRPFIEDDKNGWADYSRTLPNSVAHRVSARYIFILAEVSIVLIVLTILNKTSAEEGKKISFILDEYFPYMDLNHFFTVTSLLCGFILLSGVAFSVPLHYLFKGQKKTIIGSFPLLIAVALATYLNLSSFINYYLLGDNRILMKIAYYEKWVFIVMAVITVLLLALSWIASIVINTISGKEKLKNIKVLAAVITIAIVCSSVVSVSVLYKKGSFETHDMDYNLNLLLGEGNNSQTGMQKPVVAKEPTKGQLKCREDIIELIEIFFKESHIDVPLENTKNQLDSLGYFETEHGSGKFQSKDSSDGIISVELSRYDNNDGVNRVDINADVGTFYIEKATKKDLDKISENFSEGMTEEAMIEKFKELNVAPQYIREYVHPDYGLTRYYCLEYKVLEYNGEESTLFSINLDVNNDVVQDLRVYDY